MQNPRTDRATGVRKKGVEKLKEEEEEEGTAEASRAKTHHRVTNKMGLCVRGRIIEQEKAISYMLDVTKGQDVEVLTVVSKALGLLLDFIGALSGEQLGKVSYLKPVLTLFNTEILPVVKSDDRPNLKKREKQANHSEVPEHQIQSRLCGQAVEFVIRTCPQFKTCYNNDDRIKAVMTGLVAVATEENNPTPGPSAASAQAMAAEVGAGDDDTREAAKKTKKRLLAVIS